MRRAGVLAVSVAAHAGLAGLVVYGLRPPPPPPEAAVIQVALVQFPPRRLVQEAAPRAKALRRAVASSMGPGPAASVTVGDAAGSGAGLAPGEIEPRWRLPEAAWRAEEVRTALRRLGKRRVCAGQMGVLDSSEEEDCIRYWGEGRVKR